MPRAPTYVRLRSSESEIRVEERDLIGYYDDEVVHKAKQEEGVSDWHDTLLADQNYQNSAHEQQQKQLEDANISNGSRYETCLSQRNLNGCQDSNSRTFGTKSLKDDVHEGRSGELKRIISFRDCEYASKLTSSQSNKWQVQGRGQAHLERITSGRWRPSGNDVFTRTTGSLLREESLIPANTQTSVERTASVQRVASCSDLLQQKQQTGCNDQCSKRDNLSTTICITRSACNELQSSQRLTRQQTIRLSDKDRGNSSPARRTRFADEVINKSSPPRSFRRQQTARFVEWEKSGRPSGDKEDETPSPLRRIQRQQTPRFTDCEKKLIAAQVEAEKVEVKNLSPFLAISGTAPRTSSHKIVNSQRSFSMRETSSLRVDTENLSPRRKSSATLVKPRVSFSDVNNSREEARNDTKSQRIHEKWKDSPSAMRQSRLFTATTQPMRYNYEQPGFVERRSTDGSGFHIGGFHSNDEKENGRQPPLSRTFSTFSFTDKATYRRMAKTLTFTTGKHVQPVVVECVSCGKGLGIMIQGLPPGETSSFCKACKPGLPDDLGGLRPWNTGEFHFHGKCTSRTSSVRTFNKKKKSMLDYCRKFLGMSKVNQNK